MLHIRTATVCALAALVTAGLPPFALAQQASSPEWFVPPTPRPAVPPPARTQSRSGSQMAPVAAPLAPEALGSAEEEPQAALSPQQIQVQLPPAPVVPPVPKGAPPPAAIIGILSVPDVLRISTAYQQGDKELAARRQKLNQDVQKEQVALRDLSQALANDRGKLSPEQIRVKERELQDRLNESRHKFGERGRIIQEAGQYVMAQIDRTLEQVAQQVALSRGVNMVLNRAQILGTTADFDLTPQVAEVLNQVLPSVVIPPDGVSPLAMTPPAGSLAAQTGSGLIAAPNQPTTIPTDAPSPGAQSPALAASAATPSSAPAPAGSSGAPTQPAGTPPKPPQKH